jgi:membrane protease YdiL (CAAX protease family)
MLPGYTISQVGINMNRFAGSLLWIVILGAFLISMNFFLTRNPKSLKSYPQIQKESWNFYLILINTLSWAGYLFAYEFMFRGLLLFPLVNHLGITAAIIINTILYSATHFYKGVQEVIGAIPLGIALCLLTIEYGNILIAFFAHLCLALSCEYFALFRQQKTGNLQ